MGDFIRREAAIAETRNPRLTDAELRRRLALIPAADVAEVRHAYKIDITTVEDWAHWCKCSACGYEELFLEDEYCSHCGAKLDVSVTNVRKMDGGQGE